MNAIMKAMTFEKFGPPEVLEIREVEKPVIEKDNEVLIKVYATSVNTIDIFYRRGIKVMFGLTRLMTGIRKPRKTLLGFDLAGEIVEIGSSVTEFNVGDQVFGGSRSGANAEYATSTEASIALKPSSMTYSEAAAVPIAALSALQGLRDSGKIQQGQNLLIYGASGGIGTYAIQIAKSYNTAVTAVSSGKNEELVRKLGADSFVDYTKTDFTQNTEKFDLIFDAVGKASLSKWKNSLKEDGIFVNVGSPSMPIIRFFLRVLGNTFRKKKIRSFNTRYTKTDLEFLGKLSEEGKLKSIIDKSFPLEEIAAAHEYYEKGHTSGKIVVNIIADPLS